MERGSRLKIQEAKPFNTFLLHVFSMDEVWYNSITFPSRITQSGSRQLTKGSYFAALGWLLFPAKTRTGAAQTSSATYYLNALQLCKQYAPYTPPCLFCDVPAAT